MSTTYKVIPLTYREIFKRIHRSEDFHILEINEWYLNEGGDPEYIKTFGEKAAKYLGIQDFEIRCVEREWCDLTDDKFDQNSLQKSI